MTYTKSVFEQPITKRENCPMRGQTKPQKLMLCKLEFTKNCWGAVAMDQERKGECRGLEAIYFMAWQHFLDGKQTTPHEPLNTYATMHILVWCFTIFYNNVLICDACIGMTRMVSCSLHKQIKEYIIAIWHPHIRF